MELYSPIYQGHPLIYQPERFRLTSLRSPLCWIVALRVTRFGWNRVKPAIGRLWSLLGGWWFFRIMFRGLKRPKVLGYTTDKPVTLVGWWLVDYTNFFYLCIMVDWHAWTGNPVLKEKRVWSVLFAVNCSCLHEWHRACVSHSHL